MKRHSKEYILHYLLNVFENLADYEVKNEEELVRIEVDDLVYYMNKEDADMIKEIVSYFKEN